MNLTLLWAIVSKRMVWRSDAPVRYEVSRVGGEGHIVLEFEQGRFEGHLLAVSPNWPFAEHLVTLIQRPMSVKRHPSAWWVARLRGIRYRDMIAMRFAPETQGEEVATISIFVGDFTRVHTVKIIDLDSGAHVGWVDFLGGCHPIRST